MVEDPLKDVLDAWEPDCGGTQLFEMVSALYPICRSITGQGVRQSLALLQKWAPMSIHEVPTGTQVFDWVVPKEWNIRDAYIRNSKGEKVIDFEKSNLHVVNYSIPVHQRMSMSELRDHLFTLPETPDWIPYRTSYYRETWGFCLSQRQFDGLTDDEYEVFIDSTLQPGHLSYGEFTIPGATQDEVLISCHSCHPSLCNDNLSGMVAAAKLAQVLAGRSLRYSYRFLWIPGTIGAITWLALNQSTIPRIKHGLVLSCLGDPGRFTYKRSRHHSAEIDRVVAYLFNSSGTEFELVDFSPIGYDERQYCSPGINLPVGCFMRTPNGKYPQYHTSADDLNFISAQAMGESVQSLLSIVQILERNCSYLNQNPNCEPQLGRRGLYRPMGGTRGSGFEEAMLWVLNFSDGDHTLLEIAERSNMRFSTLDEAANILADCGLLRRAEPSDSRASSHRPAISRRATHWHR